MIYKLKLKDMKLSAREGHMGLFQQSVHETTAKSMRLFSGILSGILSGIVPESFKSRHKKHKKAIYAAAACAAALIVPMAVQAMADTMSAGSIESLMQQSPNREGTVKATTKTADGNPDVNVTHPAPNGQGQNASQSSVEVTIDGQQIPVPESGDFHKTIAGNNSTTAVDVSIQNDQSSNANVQNHSSNIEINSHDSLSSGRERREGGTRDRDD